MHGAAGDGPTGQHLVQAAEIFHHKSPPVRAALVRRGVLGPAADAGAVHPEDGDAALQQGADERLRELRVLLEISGAAVARLFQKAGVKSRERPGREQGEICVLRPDLPAAQAETSKTTPGLRTYSSGNSRSITSKWVPRCPVRAFFSRPWASAAMAGVTLRVRSMSIAGSSLCRARRAGLL